MNLIEICHHSLIGIVLMSKNNRNHDKYTENGFVKVDYSRNYYEVVFHASAFEKGDHMENLPIVLSKLFLHFYCYYFGIALSMIEILIAKGTIDQFNNRIGNHVKKSKFYDENIVSFKCCKQNRYVHRNF